VSVVLMCYEVYISVPLKHNESFTGRRWFNTQSHDGNILFGLCACFGRSLCGDFYMYISREGFTTKGGT
jgi:hypothetical protein